MRALPRGPLWVLLCLGVSLSCSSGNDDGDRAHSSGGATGGSAANAGVSGASTAGTSNSGGGGKASAGSSATSGGAGGSSMTAGSSGAGVSGASSAGAAGAGGEACAEQGNMVGMTAAHNAVRASVSTGDPLPALEWSCEIAAVAQAYANVLQGQDCPLDHSGNEDYGENIYWRFSDPPTDATPQDVVDAWAAELTCYSYDKFPDQCTPVTDVCDSCGHYTAMVWRDTLRVGCGSARCGKAEIWVCNYDPPGNFVGEYPY